MKLLNNVFFTILIGVSHKNAKNRLIYESVFFIACSGGRIGGGKEDKYGKKSVFMGF
ncbi:hypothetical protein H8D57_03535 [bacterium]|nr:hypothetical protein [bacterium]